MSWIELNDAERFLQYAMEHGDESFLADREAGDSFFANCADSPSALVPDVQEYRMGCIDDYIIDMKEIWKDSGFTNLDLLVRIIAAAALRNLYIYQREMYGGRRVAPTREQLLEVAKMPSGTGGSFRGDSATPGKKQSTPELNPIFYEF